MNKLIKMKHVVAAGVTSRSPAPRTTVCWIGTSDRVIDLYSVNAPSTPGRWSGPAGRPRAMVTVEDHYDIYGDRRWSSALGYNV